MSWLQGESPNPNTSTREAFTQFALNQKCPENADPRYQQLCTELQHLLDLLVHHEAMRPNIQQTYMTPAAKKSKVYFMWDYVGRTLGMLWAVDPKLPKSAMPQWKEVTGRAMFSVVLITDSSGKLDAMSASPGYDVNVEFGDEIKSFADGMSAI